MKRGLKIPSLSAREARSLWKGSPTVCAPSIRAQSSGKDSTHRQSTESLGTVAPATFARTEETIDDEVWRDLCNAVGPREMATNGAMWMKRLKLTRRAMALAVSDWKAKTPAEKAAGGGNAAAYITTAYDREKQKME